MFIFHSTLHFGLLWCLYLPFYINLKISDGERHVTIVSVVLEKHCNHKCINFWYVGAIGSHKICLHVVLGNELYQFSCRTHSKAMKMLRFPGFSLRLLSKCWVNWAKWRHRSFNQSQGVGCHRQGHKKYLNLFSKISKKYAYFCEK